MSDWPKTTLGEVIHLDVDSVEVDPAQLYDIIGVLNRGRGLLYRAPIQGSGTAYKSLNRIGPNQVVYSRLKAFEGAITVTPKGLPDVYASQEFPTFTCGPLLLPDYFRLLTTTTHLWATLQNLSTGMGGRRERVKPRDFLTVSIALPPLAEQRRVVDVMTAVDDHIEALAAEAGRAQTLRASTLADLLVSQEDWTARRFGEVAQLVRGISYKSSELADSGGRAFVNLRSVQRGGGYRADGLKQFTGDPKATQVLVPGDLLIACTDLTKDRNILGYPMRAPAELEPGATFSLDLAKVVVDADEISRDFLALFLQSEKAHEFMTEHSSGTTVTHLRTKDVPALLVPIPPRLDQQRIIRMMSGIDGQVSTLTNELTRLRMFRSVFLTSLLNQDIEIPESYDALLEAAS